VGCEGIAVEPGRNLVVADDPGAFAAAVVDLLRDPARAAAIGAAGRALAEQQYSWPVVARPMLDAWAAVTRGQRSVVSGQYAR
jgi:glycosyltransferase involved in cell wall biosynthesis